MTDTSTLYAVHGENDLDYDGWIVRTFGIGHDPAHHGGEDMRGSRTVIARLNNGYHPNGTIPEPLHYEDFAHRCANFVQASQGCTRWIIGNEMNVEVERPHDQPITPELYARCFDLCRAAIKALPGHTDDQVLVGAVGPWNDRTPYPGNENGDWIQYFEDIQRSIAGCDGFAIHCYAREQTVESVKSNDKMGAPFQDYHNGFRTYTDWMAAILPRFRGSPVYCTETNANAPWVDEDTGFVQAAYQEIFTWNGLHPDEAISCLALYRWEYDQWEFKTKGGVHQDFYNAVECGYELPPVIDPPIEPPVEPPQEDTLIKNHSFEEGWHEAGSDKLILPDHWWVDYKEGGDPWYRPEIKPNEEFVTDGRFSIRAFQPEHSQGFFGIWQEVDVEPGKWYRFSADVRVESKPPGELAAFAGIQPWGAGIFERQMIWGEETQTQIEWQRVEVIAQAFGPKIRVVMGATGKWATRNNTTWWDNASLEEWECDGGTEPPVEPPVEPPTPGECNVDYDRIEQMIADRAPVVWPKLM